MLTFAMCVVDLQTNEPYNCAAFDFDVEFPERYPFAPPKVCTMQRMFFAECVHRGTVADAFDAL